MRISEDLASRALRLFARDDAATYTEPLALQLFPVTESREQGKMRDSADIKIVNGDKDPSFFYAMYAAAKLGIAWNVPRNSVGIDWNAIAGKASNIVGVI